MLDSTILADAVATQDTVTQPVAAIRRVRRLVGQAREVELGAHDADTCQLVGLVDQVRVARPGGRGRPARDQIT